MPGSQTTPNRAWLAMSPPPVLPSTSKTVSAFGTETIFAARWLACAYPGQRFAVALADDCACLGGHCGSLLLQCGGLTPPTPRRFCRRTFDAVLAFAAIVIKGKNIRGAARDVGDQEAQIGSHCGVLGLVTDTPLARPGTGAMAKAGEAALRKLRSAITALQFFCSGSARR